MKKIFIIIFFSVIFSSYAAENKINAAGGLDWFTNYNDALKDAEARGTLILVNFTGSDWCSWCHKLDENVFSTQDFHSWAKENITLLYLDFPQKKKLSQSQENHNQVLAQVYGVQGFPTILVLDKKGKLVTRTGFGENAKSWISNIEQNIVLFKKYTTAP